MNATRIAQEDRDLDEAEALLDGLVPRVEVIDRDELLRRAIEHHNARRVEGTRPASTASAPSFLTRIMRGYVRHVLSDYEAVLESLPTHTAKLLARRRYERAIDAAYPWLAAFAN